MTIVRAGLLMPVEVNTCTVCWCLCSDRSRGIQKSRTPCSFRDVYSSTFMEDWIHNVQRTNISMNAPQLHQLLRIFDIRVTGHVSSRLLCYWGLNALTKCSQLTQWNQEAFWRTVLWVWNKNSNVLRKCKWWEFGIAWWQHPNSSRPWASEWWCVSEQMLTSPLLKWWHVKEIKGLELTLVQFKAFASSDLERCPKDHVDHLHVGLRTANRQGWTRPENSR
jgi:hypothetical protein